MRLLVFAGLEAALAAREAAGQGEAARGAGSKRKKGPAGEATPSAPAQLRSRLELRGHAQCVSSVAWPCPGSLVSGSLDHSVPCPSSCFLISKLKFNL